MPAETFLRFYDFHRQNYSDVLEVDYDGEFSIGDYYEGEGGVGKPGEFKIVLHDFSKTTSTIEGLTPQVRFFGDATGAVQEFIRIGGLHLLNECQSRDHFSRGLIRIGVVDLSDKPLAEAKV